MSKFLVAYATLLALKNNIDSASTDVEEKYINEFNDRLKDIEKDLSVELFPSNDFRVKEQFIQPYNIQTSYNPVTYERTSERYCETRFFLTKVDAALNYLQLIAPKKDKQRMGF